MKNRCPNCCERVIGHPQNGCVLAALIDVLRDRGSMSETKLRKLHASVNADALWDNITLIIDDLESGVYS